MQVFLQKRLYIADLKQNFYVIVQYFQYQNSADRVPFSQRITLIVDLQFPIGVNFVVVRLL